MREDHDEPHADEADAPDDDSQGDNEKVPRSAKTRPGSNVPNAAGDGDDSTHE
jgi:hypothetical protein